MSAAGADLPHLLAFEDDAEAYRYDLVQRLNQLHATEVTHARDRYAGSGERDVPSRQRIDRSHWAEMPLFAPTSRSLRWAIGQRPAPWLLIGAWTILSLAILAGVARRPRVLA
jgi:ABC-2 type transport system permease protein